jgi:hypothetical protein
MMDCKNRVSCRNLFRRLGILPLVSQYVILLMLFVVGNKNHFTLNSQIYTKSTRQINNFYHPTTNFTAYQNGVHYMGTKIVNGLPPNFKDISNNVRKFEISLKQFLHIPVHCFYSIEEYFQYKSISGRYCAIKCL